MTGHTEGDDREVAIARAIFFSMEMQALRRRMTELFPDRRESFRVLHEDYGMSLGQIAGELGISRPRVHEILKGKLA